MLDIFSVKSLVNWLEKQPTDKAYDYADGKACPCTQYFQAMGLPVEAVTMSHWYEPTGPEGRLPRGHAYPVILAEIAHGGWRPNDGIQLPKRAIYRTFGEALKLARKVQAREQAQLVPA